MIRWTVVMLLFAHGWVHMVVWGLVPAIQPQVDEPAHSWAIGERPGVVRALTLLTMTLFAVAAIGLALELSWWGALTVAAAAASLALVALFPAAVANGWFVVPLAIDLALILGVVAFGWPTMGTFGG